MFPSWVTLVGDEYALTQLYCSDCRRLDADLRPSVASGKRRAAIEEGPATTFRGIPSD